jgi:hypothetical protein
MLSTPYLAFNSILKFNVKKSTAVQRYGQRIIMSVTPQENQAQPEKTNDKELNFRALEQKMQASERRAQEAEKRAHDAERRVQEEALKKQSTQDDDDDDNEPYVDHKKLKKKLDNFGEKTKQFAQSEVQKEVQKAIYQERQSNWLKQNPDFQDVMQYAEKLAQKDPDLAESILEMPEGFERQKLVYKNIKAMGLHKPEVKASSIQEKVDSNRRGPYYQPSGVSTNPYSAGGDFTASGQKSAYEKMQELKNKLRLG